MRPILHFVSATCRRLWTDRRGNVLMITGLSIVPLTFATGMVIDYSRAARLQTKLNAAADAAALSGTTKPMLDQPLLAACARSRRTFLDAAAQNSAGLTLAADTPTVSITETYPALPSVTFTCPTVDLPIPTGAALPRSRTITVTYGGQSANGFSGILGSASIEVGGTSTATSQTTDYIDIHMALDTSQSMGLAATDADAVKLWTATGQKNGRNCQFGCHERSPSEKYSMEAIARMPDVNARMRIDVLRDATIDMINTAMNSENGGSKYRFALYRIGKNAGRWGLGVDEYAPLTGDLSGIKSKVQSLTLSANDGAIGFGDTDLSATTSFVLPKMGAKSATIDDGSTQPNARKFLFLVTDGVQDTEGWSCPWTHCTAPITASTCDPYKASGVTVGIVYTTYLPVKADPTNPSNPALRPEYTDMVKPFADQIRPNLQACASPGWFFEAADGPTIHAAMQKLFDQASKSPRLTQ